MLGYISHTNCQVVARPGVTSLTARLPHFQHLSPTSSAVRGLAPLTPSAKHRSHFHLRLTATPTSTGSADATSTLSLRDEALREFRELVLVDDDALPLLHCATLIAQHRYPELQHSEVDEAISQLDEEVKGKLGELRYPMKVISTMNEVLYGSHGFQGNSENYYDPDNSCINRVLETKRGIPITLSLVYIEVAARVGLPMVGLNFPGHLMIRPDVDDVEVMVDAFNGGEVCYLEDAEQLLSKLMNAQILIDPRFLEKGRHISSRLFLMRMLNNLKQIYLLTQDYENGLQVMRYVRAVDPGNVEHVRDEGMCLYYMQQYKEAAEALQMYAKLAPKSFDMFKVQSVLEGIDEILAERQQQQQEQQQGEEEDELDKVKQRGAESAGATESRKVTEA